jgi:hypothetical protein
VLGLGVDGLGFSFPLSHDGLLGGGELGRSVSLLSLLIMLSPYYHYLDSMTA